MNSFFLIAEVFTNPELRTTPDSQIPLASFLVQFPSSKPGEPPNRLRVTGWRDLATEIQENYHKGDQILIEGRLQMNTIDRGSYKEKVAELVAQRICPLGKTKTEAASPSQNYSPMPPIMDDLPSDEIPF
ncbi:MAG: single-stranded DNA-binding protein [Cyanobacteria bacterium M5B4]|nr:MAG: single-stranded DNA-binding protein [Cyanobacteria bacterium M5B4]